MTTDTARLALIGIIDALKSDASVSGMVGTRVFTYVPQNTAFPYILVEIRSTLAADKTDDATAHELLIDIFSREPDPSEALQVREAVFNVLNKSTSLSAGGRKIISIFHNGVAEVQRGEDDTTVIASLDFNLLVQAN